MTSFKQVWHAKWPMIVGLFLFVWAIESFSYFVVATWAGGVHGGVASAVNLQLGIDRVILGSRRFLHCICHCHLFGLFCGQSWPGLLAESDCFGNTSR